MFIIVSKQVTRGKRNESISPLYKATGITCNVYIYLMFIIVSKPVTRGKRKENILPISEATGIRCNLMHVLYLMYIHNSF